MLGNLLRQNLDRLVGVPLPGHRFLYRDERLDNRRSCRFQEERTARIRARVPNFGDFVLARPLTKLKPQRLACDHLKGTI
jgi:hypothetical protein